MLRDLRADADLRGHRIDISWVWSGLGARPAFRLLRRRRSYPAGADDGYPVLDLGELFLTPSTPWARVSRVRYRVDGSGLEGGLLQAVLAFFHEAPGPSAPSAVEVAVHVPGAEALVPERVDEVTRVERTAPASADWGAVERLEIFHAPGGGPEASAGVATVFRDHADGTTPPRFRWHPAGAAPVEVEFDSGELAQTRAEVATVTPGELRCTWERSLRLDGWDLATALSAPDAVEPEALEGDGVLTLREDFDQDSGDWTRTIRASDLRAATEVASYYTLFRPHPADPGRWTTEREWRAHATATARYGFPERLYGLLPGVHQRYDEPEPGDRGRGQLRRFVQVFGAALDHLRSGAESLRTRHDLAEVRGDLLPALGAWIDWSTDHTAPLPIQRSEIGMARAVYETVGTLPNLVPLATRVTGWECRAKEFVHNLFLTNAPEYVPVRELWEAPFDGAGLGPPVRRTTTARFDGRPVAVEEGGGRTRLFWHSNRSGRWELWTRTLEGEDGTGPVPAFAAPPDRPPLRYADLAPAPIRFPAGAGPLWLFWESDREDAWDVWASVEEGGAWGAPFRITDHRAADRRPAAALGPDDTLFVFWESERRGQAEIWCRGHDGDGWTPPVRVTESAGRDREPAAALDADGRLWLVWRRDEADRSSLYARVLEGGAWGAESALEVGPWRDESPTLARVGSDLWLLWSSERTGRWELWARAHGAGGWGEPFQLTMSPDPHKEPAVLADGAGVRIFWRSERPAPEHRSRTVDTRDTRLLEERGRFDDRIHHTYDTARGELDWYARDVVGLYVTPPPGTPARVVEEVLDRARTYLEPFIPATVRLVLIPTGPAAAADFFTDGFDVEDPLVDAFEDVIA